MTLYGATDVLPSRSARITVQIAFLRSQAQAFVRKRIGQAIRPVLNAKVLNHFERCARNCFSCPICNNTLSIVSSDPTETSDGRIPMTYSAAGEPPFFLYCNHCRWDSAEIGITFEKPTGLAGASLICHSFLLEANHIFDTAQLQKYEDSAPDALEFDRLKDHFEPFLRASSFSSSIAVNAAHPSSAAHSHHLHSTSITAAASAALARDIPGVAKYTPMSRTVSGRAHRDRTVNKDEMPEYKSRVDISSVGAGDFEVDYMRKLRNIQTVGNVEQRWGISWAGSLQTKLVALYVVQSRC